MASEHLVLRLFTPAGLVKVDSASAVTLPSSNGEIGILPGHTRYTGVLSTGVLEYVSANSSTKERWVVSEGFCNFDNDTLVVLADDVFASDDPRRENLLSKRSELEKAISESSAESIEWQLAKRELDQAEALARL